MIRARRACPARFPKTHALNAVIVAALIVVMCSTGFVWADRSVTVVVDGESREVRTQAETVADALEQSDIPVTGADVVSPALDEPLTDGCTIVVRHAVSVSLRTDGDVQEIAVVGATVADALVAAGIDLDQSAAVSPALDTPLEAGMTVVVPTVFTRVSQKIEPVPFETVVKKDGSLPKGTQVVQSEGAAGRLLKVWQSVVVDGKPGERTLTASRVMSKPKTRVIRQGTAEQKSTAPAVVAQAEEPAAPSTSSQGSSKPAATNSERSRRPASGRQLTVSSTAYSPAQPGLSSRTATGRRATKGVIAVDPRVIPLGTRVYVPGYGNAIAADTGGAIKGNKIDVCFDSVAEARAWGRRTVTITILD